MKLNTMALANSAAVTAAILWLFCSLLVSTMPGMMMSMTGHMVHLNMQTHSWMLTGFGFVLGLIAWVAAAWLTGWLIAFFYNRFADQTD